MRLLNPPLEIHVSALLEWLEDIDPAMQRPDGSVLAADVLTMYREMCLDKGWRLREWGKVGEGLREALGCRKRYAWIDTAEGKRRWCVYDLPRPQKLRLAA